MIDSGEDEDTGGVLTPAKRAQLIKERDALVKSEGGEVDEKSQTPPDAAVVYQRGTVVTGSVVVGGPVWTSVPLTDTHISANLIRFKR